MGLNVKKFRNNISIFSKFFPANVGFPFAISLLIAILVFSCEVDSRAQVLKNVYLVQENGDIYLKNGKGDRVQKSNWVYILDRGDSPTLVGREQVEGLLAKGWNTIDIEYFRKFIEVRQSPLDLVFHAFFYFSFLFFFSDNIKGNC
jgi:hypothetical protein